MNKVGQGNLVKWSLSFPVKINVGRQWVRSRIYLLHKTLTIQPIVMISFI